MTYQQALDYVMEFNKLDFKASRGWLTRFKIRHNITSAILSGERAAVSMDTVDDGKETFLDLIKDYEPRDIFNMGETGLFFRALPDKTSTSTSTLFRNIGIFLFFKNWLYSPNLLHPDVIL